MARLLLNRFSLSTPSLLLARALPCATAAASVLFFSFFSLLLVTYPPRPLITTSLFVGSAVPFDFSFFLCPGLRRSLPPPPSPPSARFPCEEDHFTSIECGPFLVVTGSSCLSFLDRHQHLVSELNPFCIDRTESSQHFPLHFTASRRTLPFNLELTLPGCSLFSQMYGRIPL